MNTSDRDSFFSSVHKKKKLVAGVAITTGVCSAAQRIHEMAATSCIALGRLLTSAALVLFNQKRSGSLSFQIITEGRMGQIFADVTLEGALRGYAKHPKVELPLFPDESSAGRRRIAPMMGKGSLSVIRQPVPSDGSLGPESDAFSGVEPFTQSTTPLVSGEIDTDIQSHLEASDQIPSALGCDVLLDSSDRVHRAGGLLVQALPGADPADLVPVRERLQAAEFSRKLVQGESGPELLECFVPGGELSSAAPPLTWKCRCSYQRVVSALRMLGPAELASMVQDKEDAKISCDFCRRQFVVPAIEVAQAFESTIVARG